MKKFLLSILITGFALNTWAQMGLGVKYSYVQSTIQLDNNYGIENAYGLANYGLVLRHTKQPFKTDNFLFGTQIEFNHAQKGWRKKFPNYESLERVYNTLEIPVTTQFMFKRGVFGLSFNVGAHFGYFLSGREETEIAGESTYEDITFYFNTDNRFEMGADGGASLYLDFNFGTFELEGRYAYGLSNVFNRDIEGATNQSSLNVMSVSLNYIHKLNFGKKSKTEILKIHDKK